MATFLKQRNIKIIKEPGTKPISLTRARRYSGIGHTKDDYLLSEYIAATTEYAELVTHEAFINRKFELTIYNCDSKIIRLKPQPIYEISQIKLLKDSYNQETILSEDQYRLVNRSVILLMINSHTDRNIQITFTSGYGTRASTVPSIIKQAILEHTHHLYIDRDHAFSVPKSAQNLYETYNSIKRGSDVSYL